MNFYCNIFFTACILIISEFVCSPRTVKRFYEKLQNLQCIFIIKALAVIKSFIEKSFQMYFHNNFISNASILITGESLSVCPLKTVKQFDVKQLSLMRTLTGLRKMFKRKCFLFTHQEKRLLEICKNN